MFIATIDKLREPSFSFRYFQVKDGKHKLCAVCAIETITADTCEVTMYMQVERVNFKRVRKLLHRKINKLGFKKYGVRRSYKGKLIVNNIRVR